MSDFDDELLGEVEYIINEEAQRLHDAHEMLIETKIGAAAMLASGTALIVAGIEFDLVMQSEVLPMSFESFRPAMLLAGFALSATGIAGSLGAWWQSRRLNS